MRQNGPMMRRALAKNFSQKTPTPRINFEFLKTVLRTYILMRSPNPVITREMKNDLIK
jgi:hypothetical protein